MVRIPHYLTLGVLAAVSLAQSAQASDRHYRHHHRPYVVAHRSAQAIKQEVANSPFYGPFGGYAGPNARHYFGYGSGPRFGYGTGQRSQLQGLVEQEASANGVPASLVHRVIMRESGYNPRAANAGNYGLMQIRLGTARAMGYSGSAAGLLDPETNMTYAVRYLAGAYRAAHGNETLAVALYARGYNAPRVHAASFNTPAPTFASSGYGGSLARAASPAFLAYVPAGAESPAVNRVKRFRRPHP
jgi:soluble lytic murein transglycosylase-like protein